MSQNKCVQIKSFRTYGYNFNNYILVKNEHIPQLEKLWVEHFKETLDYRIYQKYKNTRVFIGGDIEMSDNPRDNCISFSNEHFEFIRNFIVNKYFSDKIHKALFDE